MCENEKKFAFYTVHVAQSFSHFQIASRMVLGYISSSSDDLAIPSFAKLTFAESALPESYASRHILCDPRSLNAQSPCILLAAVFKLSFISSGFIPEGLHTPKSAESASIHYSDHYFGRRNRTATKFMSVDTATIPKLSCSTHNLMTERSELRCFTNSPLTWNVTQF